MKAKVLPFTGADPGFFLGGGGLVYCSTSTPINHIVFFFFFQNTSCIRKPQVISGGGGGRTPCTLPLDPPLVYDFYVGRSLTVHNLLSLVHNRLQQVKNETFLMVSWFKMIGMLFTLCVPLQKQTKHGIKEIRWALQFRYNYCTFSLWG